MAKAPVRVYLPSAPSAGWVAMCDFDAYGFSPPEMVKVRRCIVVSSKPRNRKLRRCVILPVSKTKPQNHADCIEILPGTYNCFHPTAPVWVLCDMPYTLDWRKMWLVEYRGRAQRFRLDAADWVRVKAALQALV